MSTESLPDSGFKAPESHGPNSEFLAALVAEAAKYDSATVPVVVEVNGGRSLTINCFILRPALSATRYSDAQPMYVAVPYSGRVAAVRSREGVNLSIGVLWADGEPAMWFASLIDNAVDNLAVFGNDYALYNKWAREAQQQAIANMYI